MKKPTLSHAAREQLRKREQELRRQVKTFGAAERLGREELYVRGR